MSKKSALIVKSFNDAGTGENFTAGETRSIDAGAFTNYEAAGLVRVPDAKSKPAASSKPRSSSRRSTSKPATTETAPPSA